MALGPGDASRVQILDWSLLYVLLGKSGAADGWCPGEGQGQDREPREGLQASRGDVRVVQNGETKTLPLKHVNSIIA